MSIKLAILLVFVVFTGSFVRCDDEEIDWDLYGEYIISTQERIVGDLADYAYGIVSARNSCYMFWGIVAAAVQSGPNVNRYHIRMLIRYDLADGSGYREGNMDVVADYATVNNPHERFQIVSIRSRDTVPP